MEGTKIITGFFVLLLLFGCMGQAQIDQPTSDAETEGRPVDEPTKEPIEDTIENGSPKIEEPDEEIADLTPQVVDTSPAPGEKFARHPSKVIINTNFDLVAPSEITVFANDKKASLGATKLSEDKLSMEVALNQGLQDGTYRVIYMACNSVTACIRDEYVFSVDKSLLQEYQDLRGKNEVTVKMDAIAFEPQNIRISPGTTVTFVNEEDTGHFVNSDPHPSHTFIPEFNSGELARGETFSYTFNEVGEVHYHCSAHVPEQMVGRIIVEGKEVVVTDNMTTTPQTGSTSAIDPFAERNEPIDFSQIRAAHFVSSNPTHGAVVKAPINKVSINFNFNLHEKSRIIITRNGNPSNGLTTVVDDLTLETPLNTNVPGPYIVTYSACWPDGSCHSGKFGFTIEN